MINGKREILIAVCSMVAGAVVSELSRAAFKFFKKDKKEEVKEAA